MTAIYGHRGAAADSPPNTLPAFELAVDQGADGTELDVHITKDGAVVVIHDFTVDSTTGGTGTVSEMTLAELKALDAGNWFAPEFAGVRIPTLDEVFEVVGQQLHINVEIKSMSIAGDGVEQAVARIVQQYGISDRVIVSSFNPLVLKRFREIMPQVRLGYLFSDEVPDEVIQMAKDLTYEAEHPHYSLVDAEFVAAAHAAGRAVNVWTVNDADEARRLHDLGVDAIITDQPKAIRDALSQ
jgi:glycerophosphoryl diester phosphodiesterase